MKTDNKKLIDGEKKKKKFFFYKSVLGKKNTQYCLIQTNTILLVFESEVKLQRMSKTM